MTPVEALDRIVHCLDRAHDNSFRAKAFDLLTATATQKAFRLDTEPAKVRDGYGRNIYGQSVLLARRLIEAGTRVVDDLRSALARGMIDM